MWRRSLAIASNNAAPVGVVRMYSPCVQVIQHNARFYASAPAPAAAAPPKREVEEFESEIAPELVKKYDDARVTDRSKVTPAPAHLTGKAGILAMRLFENASAFNKIDEVGNDLNKLRRLTLKNEDFDSFLKDKSFQKTTQHQVFDSILEKAPRVLQRFFALNIVEEANVSRLMKIVDSYNELLSAHRKEVDVIITVAEAIDSKKLDKIKADVLSKLPKGSSPNWKVQVKPEIGGGLIVDAGEHYSLDESHASQEADLRRRIDIILNKVRTRIADELKDGSRMEDNSTIENVDPAARREKRAQLDKATRASQQADFDRNYVNWV